MTSDEILAELRAGAPAAPDHLRDRVRTTVAAERSARRLAFTPRRASVAFASALVFAAVGAAVVHGFTSSGGRKSSATSASAMQPTRHGMDQQGGLETTLRTATHGAKRTAVPKAVDAPAFKNSNSSNYGAITTTPSASNQTFGADSAASPALGKSLPETPATVTPLLPESSLPAAPLRLQDYDASLGVAVKNPAALSRATVQAMSWTRALGGYVAKVSYATPSGRKGEADLLLRVPVAKVQTALQKLSSLGVLTSQHVSIQDLQGTVNAQTKRIITLNRRIGTILDELEKTQTVDQEARLQGELTARRQELAALTVARNATTREGRLAHIYLNLHTKAAARKKKHVVVPAKPSDFRRRIDSAGHVLATELAVFVYALVVLGPFLLLGALGYALARAQRRRTDRRVLAS